MPHKNKKLVWTDITSYSRGEEAQAFAETISKVVDK